MPNTAKGWPYPAPADAITVYPAMGQSLANKLDAEQTIEGATIAAIAAAVGGPGQGKRALLRNSLGDRMALVYDAALGKWIGPEIWYPLLSGADTFTGAGMAPGGVAEQLGTSRAPILAGKPWADAGLTLQVRQQGLFGMDFSGSVISRETGIYIYGANVGDSSPYANKAFTAVIPITAPSGAPTLHSRGWDNPTGPLSWNLLTFGLYFYGNGAGTYAYKAQSVSLGVRWVSA